MPDATEARSDDNADSAPSPTIKAIDEHPLVIDDVYTNGLNDTSEHPTTHHDPNGLSTPDHETTLSVTASKKRKFEELNQRSRSTSRAASPPWKAFAADGPTQFTENGKRRSGRVNYIPLELQPPSDKRKTRAAHESSVAAKAKQDVHPARTTNGVSQGRTNIVKSESKIELSKKLGSPKVESNGIKLEKEPESVKPTRVSSRQRRTSKHYDDVAPDQETPRTPSTTKKRPRRPSTGSRGKPSRGSPEARRVKQESTTEGRDELRGSQSSPKLRLKLSRGPFYPRHPDFIPKPSKYSSLIEVLDTYDIKERDAVFENKEDIDPLDLRPTVIKKEESSEDVAVNEAQSRLRVLAAAQLGGPLSQERSTLFLPDEQGQLPPAYCHNDHLWAQGAYFGVLLRRERARHIELARKTAHACLAKWKERQPQTEEEKEREENEWFKLTYRQVALDIRRKWELVTGEIERRRLAGWIEEQELTRDRKMQRLLEDTTKMLDRRRVGLEGEVIDSEGMEDTDADSEGGSEDDNDSGSEGATGDDDDNMSSSESEHDSEVEEALDADATLSPEALRLKYANLPELEHDTPNEDESAMDLDDNGQAVIKDDAVEDEEDGGDMSHVVLEDVDEALLDDEDDESTDMSDDMGSSDDDGSEDDSDDDEDESAEDEAPGLMGFFGGRERRKITDTPDKDDEEVEVDTGLAILEDDANADDDSGHHTAQQPAIEVSDLANLQPAMSLEGDHSSQPTPMDSTTTAATEAESTTTIDPEEIAKIMPTVEETQPHKRITTKVPSLLRGTLREYQHFGLDWLAKLYLNQTNGILADEMGLGKTIQTIALLAHLAEEHEVWGPHLIVVPTSVILNWEMEFKKFLPGFKVLSYYGSQEERQQKRKGWSNPDNYNVVITSYQLILKDLSSIRVPEWHYMILDEAHNIKNFQSQRYQAMIRLKTHARLLLTGTPLQNSIQELWSLLTFLTAGQDGQGMGDLDEFTQWFKRPVDEIFVDGKNKLGIEAQEIVNKLHHSLRPYILRRIKAQVEKQLPGKYEHTVFCRLSKRQRQLYDAFLSRTDVKEKLSSGNPISVSQALMALRKVCNHPDLFEERPIVTSFTVRKPYSRVARSVLADFEIKDMLVRRNLLRQEEEASEFDGLILRNFDLRRQERQSRHHAQRAKQLNASKYIQRWVHHMSDQRPSKHSLAGTTLSDVFAQMHYDEVTDRISRLQTYMSVTNKRVEMQPMLGADLVMRCTVFTNGRLALVKSRQIPRAPQSSIQFEEMMYLPSMVKSFEQRGVQLHSTVEKFAFVTPNAVAQDIYRYSVPETVKKRVLALGQSDSPDPFHEARVRLSIAFPDKRLLQYDCGKLQRLALLLRELHDRGSRALIFTQMTSVLDILERFLNIHGYKYMRLDGSTRIEQRQDMMERFNRDDRIDVFILSSRSGGVGMNLTGADSVIFYDLDWNPQMDKQCQDRAHRIGQTRDVHIYKMVSEHTIEVNILKKSNQKRMLDEVVIQEGEFTTEAFDRRGHLGEDDSAEDSDDNKGYEAQDAAGAAVDRVLGLSRRADDVGKVLAAAEESIDVEAAKAQQKEAYLDEADFDFDNKRNKTPTSGIATPAVGPERVDGEMEVGVVGTEMETEVDPDYKPHVDEYMLRFIERALKDVPFVPPVDKSKRGRLDKNGRDRSHRPKKL